MTSRGPWRIFACAVLFISLGCTQPGGSGARPRTFEDSAYAIARAKFVHDSTVIDSLTRLVRTDTLFKLYRDALLPGANGQVLLQKVWCEEVALRLRYGILPASRAMNRMKDTVYRDRGVHNADDAFEVLASIAPNEGQVEGMACKRPTNILPNPLNGTPLDVEPVPPRKP
jgi:hypothetical protein